MKPAKLSKTQIQSTVTAAIRDAVDFIETEIAPDRVEADKYFKGGTKLEVAADNRSRVVATKVRDVIRAVEPGIIRLFMQSGDPVEFIPSSARAAKTAEQQTTYGRHVFNSNNGFMILKNAIHDALRKKTGFVKVAYEDNEDVDFDEYSGLSYEELAALGMNPDMEAVEVDQAEDGTFSAKFSKVNSSGKMALYGIAPEDFFIDRGASSLDDYYVCGNSAVKRVGEVVAMGFDFSQVYDLGGVDGDDEEELERTPNSESDDESANDPSMRKVLLTEAYMKMDIEGTGIPRLYKFICAGEDYTVLDHETASYTPYAKFEIDPEPHTFFGRSIADIIKDDQDAATSLLRGLLDGIAMLNNPGLAINDKAVNMADALNNEIGRVIRVNGPVAGQFAEMLTGQAATSTLPALLHYDEVIRGKTGVVGAGMGLDANALQSQTAAGVRLVDQTTNAVSELMTRVLAEGGMKRMMQLIAKIARHHQGEIEVTVGGGFEIIDPRSWSDAVDMRVSVGLGTNKAEEKAMGLRENIQWMEGVYQAYGPNNGIVTLTGIRQARADLAKMMGLYGFDKYVMPMTIEREMEMQQAAAQAAAQQPPTPDPYVMGKEIEARSKMQIEAAKDQSKMQLEAAKMARQDDLERDKMAQDLFIKSAEIGARPVNIPAIQYEQGKPRV